MPSKIRVLSDHTINQIAAGEVIENPASVVKELVENSIDAGATDICVEIQGGGRQLIRVSDNGCGMGSDDAVLCLERHATSKLRAVDDIHTLMTMGFRGEAIPSIASISKFNLLTCPFAEEKSPTQTGSMVIVDGGKLISCTPAVRSPGTTIEVKSLFFNVPVRKKFLKSPAIDANEILKGVSMISLGQPNIKFQLINDGKNVLSTSFGKNQPFKEQLRARIEEVLGKDLLQNAGAIHKEAHGISVQGFVGLPSNTRHNRTGQYLFINRRAVVSPLVAYAVKEGYGSSLEPSRFPVFVLHLTLDGQAVDVNVHPQKREVRLRQEQAIRELIVDAVRGALAPNLTALPKAPQMPISPVFAQAFSLKESYTQEEKGWQFHPRPTTPAFNIPSSPPKNYSAPPPIATQTHFSEKAPAFQPLRKTPPKVIGAIPRYLLAEAKQGHALSQECQNNQDGLLLIDQKNAQARVIYEKLTRDHSSRPLALQTLLIPHTLELAAHESEALRLSLPQLNAMGIHIKEFGSHTFIIDALPQIISHANLDAFIRDIIHDLRALQTGQYSDKGSDDEKTKAIALAASRSAMQADKCLSIFEGQALVDQLSTCQQPSICPSGKPVCVHLDGEDLAKLFQK